MCKEITCSSDGTLEGGPNISGGGPNFAVK